MTDAVPATKICPVCQQTFGRRKKCSPSGFRTQRWCSAECAHKGRIGRPTGTSGPRHRHSRRDAVDKVMRQAKQAPAPQPQPQPGPYPSVRSAEVRRLAALGMGRTAIAAMLRIPHREVDAALERKGA